MRRHLWNAQSLALEPGTFRHFQHDQRLGRAACAVGRQRPDVPDLAFEPIHNEQLYLVAGARSKWARARRLKFAALADEPWVHAAVEAAPGSPTLRLVRSEGHCDERIAEPALRPVLGSGRFVNNDP